MSEVESKQAQSCQLGLVLVEMGEWRVLGPHGMWKARRYQSFCQMNSEGLICRQSTR